MSKLILGTAQFGSDYGIKHDGQPSLGEIRKIADVAWRGGIRRIHYSWQYKLPSQCKEIFQRFDWIKKQKDPKYFTLGGQRGKAIYNREEINSCEERLYMIPLNILDNRFLNFIKTRVREDCQFIVRSVFLQGLLLMRIDQMPEWILGHDAIKRIALFQQTCKRMGLKFYEGALGWVLGLDGITGVIIGVNSARQLHQLLKVQPLQWIYDFSIEDEAILDPRQWPTYENQMKWRRE